MWQWATGISDSGWSWGWHDRRREAPGLMRMDRPVTLAQVTQSRNTVPMTFLSGIWIRQLLFDEEKFYPIGQMNLDATFSNIG
jgi:hypothetical protein